MSITQLQILTSRLWGLLAKPEPHSTAWHEAVKQVTTEIGRHGES